MSVKRTCVFSIMFLLVCLSPAHVKAQSAANDNETLITEQERDNQSDASTETKSEHGDSGAATDIEKLSNTEVVPSDITTKDDYTKDLPAPEIRSPARYAGRVIFSLLLVIALIIGTVYVLRYFYSRSMRLDLKSHHIRVLDTVSLGMNRAVFMVQVGTRVLLLGTADKGLVYLAEVTDAVDMETLLEEQGGGPVAGLDFRQQIQRAVGAGKRGEEKGARTTQFNERLKDKLKRLDGQDDDSLPPKG